MSDITENEEFIARPYQQAIIDICIKRNSICFLPTGAGKSFIAIQVIRHFGENIERKYSDGGKRSVFLVNTVCLAKQQAENIADLVPYKVCLLSGEQNVDYWKESDWRMILDEHQILVSTAQVILDAIKRSFIKLKQINVLVFDECHHGRKDHAYHEVMKQFKDISVKTVRIIGLSGMLIGNHNKITPNTVVEELQQLEATYQSTIISVNNVDDYNNVQFFSTNATESLLKFSKEPEQSGINKINCILETTGAKLKKVKLDNYATINPKTLRGTIPGRIKDIIHMFDDFVYQATDMGPFGGYVNLRGTLVQLKLVYGWCDTESYRKVVKMSIESIEWCIKEIQNIYKINVHDGPSILNNSSDKVRKLFNLLAVKFKNTNREKDLQCLVFVKRRSTAKGLYHALKAYAKVDRNFPIKPDFMVGVNNLIPESIEAIIGTNRNSLTLENFRKRETNVIVTSSVLEEGIDLQTCNLVVMYDKPDTYRSYVQARGRARVNNSNYVILIEDDTIPKFVKKLLNWQAVDSELKSQLLMKTLYREPPKEEAISKEREEAWPPFISKNGSVLNSLNAVSLLNHYASKIPADRFTNLKIYWRRIDLDDGKVRAGLELPVNSTIKEEIIGDPKDNVRQAKQHAAFKACIQLYINGELNDNLVPYDEKQKVEIYNDEYFPHWEAYPYDNENAGTRNHRRYHQKKIPKVLENSAPAVGKSSFIYRIEVRPEFDTPNKAQKMYWELMKNKNEFGILTSTRLPKMCRMKLFQTFGEIDVEINFHTEFTLRNESELNTLQNFHVTIFKDLLNTWQKYFVLDKTSYLIVPLTKDGFINWDLVNEFQSLQKPRRLTHEEVITTEFSSLNYRYRVVSPVYRDPSQKFVVVDVPEHITPLSPFPNDSYATYQEYYFRKYNLNILKTDQPLIKVKGISSKFNLFFPGTGAGGKQRRQEKEHWTEYYIPEICHNYKFPADYWLKATLLPSICHRMHYMLLAEELRMWLIDEKIDLNCGCQTGVLDVDYGNYDEREKMIGDIERQHEEYGQFMNILEIKQQNPQTLQKSKAHCSNELTLWDTALLPIDVDRNWLTSTEADIQQYCDFVISQQRRFLPKYLSRPRKQLNGLQLRPKSVFKISEDRQKIRCINMTAKDSSVQQKDIIKVLTTSNAGDVFDMERFEVLGDGFLKFIVSLHLYKMYDEWHEGHLTAFKGKIVSNRNLFYHGNNFGLSGMIKSSRFDAYKSLPPSVKIPSNVQVEENKRILVKMVEASDSEESDHIDESYNQQCIGDKAIADAVEGFLGLVVQSIGLQAGLKVCQKLKILPEQTNINNLLTERILPRHVLKTDSSNNARVSNRYELEKIIGYNFKDSKYLLQALTHPSYPIKTIGSYQQLEFLGDAVLDFLVTSYISENCAKMDPGKLTDLRSALVNNATLACIIVRKGIHKYLLSKNVLLTRTIKKFVAYQNNQNHRVVLDQTILLEAEEDSLISEAVEIPKVIGDLFESIVGAVYLDSGLNLVTTWDVIYGLLKDELHEFMENIPLQIIRQLYEHEKGSAKPKFFDAQDLGNGSVAVPLKFNCGVNEEKLVVGYGKNKKLAKKSAAKLAMKELTASKEQ